MEPIIYDHVLVPVILVVNDTWVSIHRLISTENVKTGDVNFGLKWQVILKQVLLYLNLALPVWCLQERWSLIQV